MVVEKWRRDRLGSGISNCTHTCKTLCLSPCFLSQVCGVCVSVSFCENGRKERRGRTFSPSLLPPHHATCLSIPFPVCENEADRWKARPCSCHCHHGEACLNISQEGISDMYVYPLGNRKDQGLGQLAWPPALLVLSLVWCLPAHHAFAFLPTLLSILPSMGFYYLPPPPATIYSLSFSPSSPGFPRTTLLLT